jgi:hypothetical protein
MCNARIRTVIRDGQAVLDVGRSHRVVSDTQFRALLLRDQGCRAPGCGSRTGLEAHHLEHWADGGNTDMTNLVLLCRRHHHLHHDGVITIDAGPNNTLTFRRADRTPIPHNPHPTDAVPDGVTPLRTTATLEHVPADAATTNWLGEPFNRHYTVGVIATNRRRYQAPSP